MIYVDNEKCDGCGVCIETCPHHALKLVDGAVEVDRGLCQDTKACISACPQEALLELVEPGEKRDHPVPVVVEAPLAERKQAAVAKRSLGLTALLGAALQFLVHDVAPELWRQWSSKRGQTSSPASRQARPMARGRCRGKGKQHRRRRKGLRA